MSLLIFIIVLLAIIFIYLYIVTKRELEELKKIHGELKFDYRSAVVKHGKNWENFVPFMPEFERVANKDNFVFLGMPIDGISFDEDAIKFIEIKTGKSNLSIKQKAIKRLVEDKKIRWHELRYS